MEKLKEKKTHQRFVLILILFFHSVNTTMDRACISAAKEGIKLDLNISDQMMGYIFGIFALGYALFQIPSGWIADRFGPRKALTGVVSIWSVFTAATGAAWNAASMLVLRLLFGVGEAGAFPGATRAFYRWLPVRERGIGHGVNFSGARLGAAVSLFLMPILIRYIGWRWTFVVNGLIGIIWATVWLLWFRDEPQDNRKMSQAELEYIEKGRDTEFVTSSKATFGQIFTSLNMGLSMIQYIAHNMTFFICFTWLLPYLNDKWGAGAEIYAPIPLVLGAVANWVSGGFVSWLYHKGYHVGSRRFPAITGYALAAIGLIAATQTDQIGLFIAFFSMTIFGIDMILSPSWAFCMDIGGDKSGAVSASMNMAGNLGAGMSAVLFPFFVANVTVPFFAPVTGTANSFFIFCAILNIFAIVCWLFMNPKREANTNLTPAQVKLRVILFSAVLFFLTAGSIAYRFLAG